MQPTARITLERIAEALENTVLPALPGAEKWASSTVRSAVTLLNQLAKRVAMEGPILAADNDDARAVLRHLLERIRPNEDKRLKEDIEAALQGAAPSPYDIAAMDERNTEYQSLFDRLLRDQYDGQWRGVAAQPIRGAIRAYLKRRLARERDLYLPEFTGPPF